MRQFQNIELTDNFGSYIVTDGEMPKGITIENIIYDSYINYPSEAPDEIKYMDYAMGPGYWNSQPQLNEDKQRIKPNKIGARLIVIKNINVKREAKILTITSIKETENVFKLIKPLPKPLPIKK